MTTKPLTFKRLLGRLEHASGPESRKAARLSEAIGTIEKDPSCASIEDLGFGDDDWFRPGVREGHEGSQGSDK